MIIDITTHANLNFELGEYNNLIKELETYIKLENTDLVLTLEELLDDLILHKKQLSNFSVGSYMEFKYAGEFFKDLHDDIEDMDTDEYPILYQLLITLAISI